MAELFDNGAFVGVNAVDYEVLLSRPLLMFQYAFDMPGAVFPLGWAILITYIGLAVASGVGYFSGKKLGEDKIRETLAKYKYKKAASFLDSRKNLTSMCFLVRLLPLPKDLFSMFFGAVGMPFFKFVLISLAGLTPVMLSSVIAGALIAG